MLELISGLLPGFRWESNSNIDKSRRLIAALADEDLHLREVDDSFQIRTGPFPFTSELQAIRL